MKWKKYTIETTTAAEDFMSSMLMELGIEGIEIEDNIPLTKEDQADMFIDFLPELPPDEGISHVSFYIEDDGSDQSDMLRKVKLGLEDLRDTVDVGSGVISSSETEDLDWINNWKKYFSSFTIGDILIKPTWEEVKLCCLVLSCTKGDSRINFYHKFIRILRLYLFPCRLNQYITNCK